MSQQRPQHLFIASLECQVQQGIAIAVQQGWVGAGLQQELNHLGLLGDDCQMQWCLQDRSTSSAVLTRGAKSCTTILSSSCTLFRSVASPQQEQLQEPPGLENRSEELLPGGELAALKNMYLLQVIGDVDDLLAGDANNDVDQLLGHSCLFMDNSEVQRPVERGMAPSSAPCFSRYSYCPQSPPNGSDRQQGPMLSLQTPHVLTCLRSHPATRPGASGLPAACGGRR